MINNNNNNDFKVNLLLCDDNDNYRTFLAESLYNRNPIFHIDEANNPDTAISKLKNERFHFAVIDLTFSSEINAGDKIAQFVYDKCPATKCVFLTAHTKTSSSMWPSTYQLLLRAKSVVKSDKDIRDDAKAIEECVKKSTGINLILKVFLDISEKDLLGLKLKENSTNEKRNEIEEILRKLFTDMEWINAKPLERKGYSGALLLKVKPGMKRLNSREWVVKIDTLERINVESNNYNLHVLPSRFPMVPYSLGASKSFSYGV